jgi:hypothetical protein
MKTDIFLVGLLDETLDASCQEIEQERDLCLRSFSDIVI